MIRTFFFLVFSFGIEVEEQMSQEVAMTRLTAIARGFLGRRAAAKQRRRRLRPSPPPAPKPKRTRRALTEGQIEYLTLLTQQCFFNMETLSTETVATGADAGDRGKQSTKHTTASKGEETTRGNRVVVCG